MKHLKTITAVAVVALLLAAVGAQAGGWINGGKLKPASVGSAKLKPHSIGANRLTKKLVKRINAKAQPGPQGATGPQGPAGAARSGSALFSILARNTIGAAYAIPSAGPRLGNGEWPPYGSGSLYLGVASGADKISYGTELGAFLPIPLHLSLINRIGFYAAITGEDVAYGAFQPNITFEVNPQVAGKTYSSLVFVPDQASFEVNGWSDYIDAAGSYAGWYFTNATVAAETGCTQADFCTLDEAQAGAPDATILSLAVGKGRDTAFQGYVDGLTVNGFVFNFEASGTFIE